MGSRVRCCRWGLGSSSVGQVKSRAVCHVGSTETGMLGTNGRVWGWLLLKAAHAVDQPPLSPSVNWVPLCPTQG